MSKTRTSFVSRHRRLVVLVTSIVFAIGIAHCVARQRLFNAIAERDTASVKLLLNCDPCLVYSSDSSGSAALNSAVEMGEREIVRLLISKGSNLNHDSSMGMPLHIAGYFDRGDIADDLLRAGASIESKTQSSLIESDATPLHQAAAGGSADVVRLLLAYGANVNARTADGRTPLHFAINVQPERKGRLEVIDQLLSHGADVNAVDQDGGTALSYVKNIPNIYDTKKMVEILESHGAK